MTTYNYMENEDAIDRLRRLPKKWMNLIIIAINILVFVLVEITGSSMDSQHMLDWGACYTPLILDGEYYRLLTGMFLHFGLTHLANNMLILLFLGDELESLVGGVRYLLIFLGGGVLGNVFSCFMDMHSANMYLSAGASGGVFAVMGALLVICIREREKLGKKLVRRMAVIVALSAYNGFADTGIDAYAHLGGLIGGALLAFLLYRKKKGDLPAGILF